MAITIGGIRITRIALEMDKETGGFKLTGSYDLMSNIGKILAKQTINGYQDVPINLSAETHKLINDTTAAIQADINNTLGLE